MVVSARLTLAASALLLLLGSAPAEAPKRGPTAEQPPREPAGLAASLARERPNQVRRFAGGVKARASSTWSGWPAARAVDGDPATSWFSAAGESAARGKRPWVELSFPEAIEVARVRLVGNREPPWQQGYSVRVVELALYDAEGRLLAKLTNESAAATNDIELAPAAPVKGVRRVRLTALADQGDANPYGDVAIGEIEVF